MNTKRYDITNARVISQSLPFYARGRKLILLLEAITHPLESIHDTWKEWALERMIEASVTSQPMSLIWYLNHLFRKYFENKTESFGIIDNLNDQASTIWYLEEQVLHEGDTPWMPDTSSEATDDDMKKLVTYNLNEKESNAADITIYAPKIVDTTLFSTEMYENEIRKSVDKYITTNGLTYEISIG